MGMMLTRCIDRRVRLGPRKWLLDLPVVALLSSLALATPATAAPRGVSVSINTTSAAPCTVATLGTWTAVPDQAFINDQLIDQQTGFSITSNGPIASDQTTGGENFATLAELAKGKHHFTATITIEDAAHNPLLTGASGKSLRCFIP